MVNLDALTKTPSLNAVFTKPPLKPITIYDNPLNLTEMNTLIIDVNRKWSSTTLPSSSHILQPNTKTELLNLLIELPLYINPRLELIWVDELPNYFRDFQNEQTQQFQNMSALGLSLSLLKQISTDLPIFFTTYSNSYNPNAPIFPQHTNYYSDNILKFEIVDNEIVVSNKTKNNDY